jgi:hypothetical protein
MDVISPAAGRSVTITQAGPQQVTNIPGVSQQQIAGTNISVDGTLNCYTRAAGWSGFSKGDIVDVATFATGANNGRKRVSNVTDTQLFVTDTGLLTEAAGASATVDRMLLPRSLLLMGTTAIPKFNLWHCDGGTPPAAGFSFYVGVASPLVINCGGFSTFTTDGASGSVSVTPLEG